MPKSILDVARRADEFFMNTISLQALLELKIASGITAPHRPRDLDDAIQLIRINGLPQNCSETINPYGAQKFVELWQAAQVRDDY